MNKLIHLLLIAMAFSLFTGSCKKESVGCHDKIATNYDAKAEKSDNCLCKYEGVNSNCITLRPTSINIEPILEENATLGYIAVGEMIFKYYGIPTMSEDASFKCGILGVVDYKVNGACSDCRTDCASCSKPAGSASVVSSMLTNYPKMACKGLHDANTTINSHFISAHLNSSFLINELNRNRPVIVGFNPGPLFALPGNAEHVALVTGYFYSSDILMLKINDPFPYSTISSDPYVDNGGKSNGNQSYEISYEDFKEGMNWESSWYNIGW